MSLVNANQRSRSRQTSDPQRQKSHDFSYHRHMALREWFGRGAIVVLAMAGVSGCDRTAVSSRPVALVVSGDTAGWIVPCGCASNQSGGLLRRGTYLAQLRKTSDVVLADAGGAPGGTQAYDRERFEAILSGEMAMGVAAHNLGAAEARMGAEYLRDTARRLSVPFVSANLRDSAGQELAPATRVVDVEGRKVALIGVMSESFKIDGLSILPPQRAVLDAIAKLPRPCEIVVLAYAPESELTELARALPEVDMVVGGPTGQAVLPHRVGRVLVASATNKGKFLAQLPIPPAAAKQQEPPSSSGEAVEMTERFIDDPQQRENLDRFYQRLAERDLTPRDTSFVSHQPVEFPAAYRVAGNEACRACHRVDAEHWEKTGHGHAWKTLVDKGAHVDSFCQQCHSTAYGLPGGFESPRRTSKLVDVGCESCHGPSQSHASDPRQKTALAGAAANRCTSCHDAENSPRFVYDQYWPKIRHGAKANEPAPARSGKE